MTNPANEVRFAWCEAATNSDNFILAIGYVNGEQSERASGKVKITCLDTHTPPFNAVVIIKRFAETLRAKGIDRVMSDRHSSHWAKQEFARHCIAFEFAELVRGDLKREFLALLTAKKIVMPQVTHDAELRKQLQSLTHKKNHGGADDVLVAVAGVALQAMGKCSAVRVTPDYV